MFTTSTDTRSARPARQARRPDATEPSRQPDHLLELSGRAVLLATDGSACADAAARVAYELARKYHAVIHVVSVVDPRAAVIPSPLYVAFEMGDAGTLSETRHEHEHAVSAELVRAVGAKIDWPVRVMFGTTAASIVQEANHLGAVLVLLGLRRHSRLERAVHDETALNVMRTASCPVLGVVAEMNGLPARVLASVDFGDGSVLAARAARAMLGDGATMTLAYVQPVNGFLLDEGECRIHDMGVKAGFTKLREEFGGTGVRFDHVVLHHDTGQSPAQALLEYADEIGSDLITAGSVQHSRLDRWMVGSVSMELVRDGRRSVLIVPPRHRE
jgi:nucleotide-binding universal stress UspA family protein